MQWLKVIKAYIYITRGVSHGCMAHMNNEGYLFSDCLHYRGTLENLFLLIIDSVQ